MVLSKKFRNFYLLCSVSLLPMNQTLKDYLLNNSSVNNLSTNVSNNSSKLITNSTIILRDSVDNITQNATNLILQTDPGKIDPNWFYSSSAQCAAAIVGLMGAFLTTKLINQKSFVEQLRNEISDYNRKIMYINQEILPKIEYIKDIDFKNNCNKAREILEAFKLSIDPNNPPSFDELYDILQLDEKCKDIPKEAFIHEYNDEYIDNVREAAEELIYAFFKDPLTIIDLQNPPDALSLYNEGIKEEEYEFMVMSVFEEKYKVYLEKLKEERKLSKTFESILGMPQCDFRELMKTPSMSDIQIESREDIENNRIKLERYSRYKEDIDSKKIELIYYTQILNEKEHMLEFNKEIPGLKKNVCLLFSFSIFSLFLPLFMLILDDATMIKYRLHTFILMLIGWMFIVFNLKDEVWGLISKGSK